MMKFVIHSKSERGFWNKKLGWVYRAPNASKFIEDETEVCRLPISRGDDAEYLPYEYDECGE